MGVFIHKMWAYFCHLERVHIRVSDPRLVEQGSFRNFGFSGILISYPSQS